MNISNIHKKFQYDPIYPTYLGKNKYEWIGFIIYKISEVGLYIIMNSNPTQLYL